ncbi:Cytoplasmic protein required for cell [Madurella fahalii]|uniref:Cytoplasmic protein required for cell n=1 Tax=Madurella fahalii TaxID=1157608 RepID=A0ABQ0FYG1_9PEZI
MENSDLENANPTILSVSQLPSRRRKGPAARHGPDSQCDSIVYPKRPWPYGSSPSSDEDVDEADIVEEPMDAQDIYDLISTISDPEHPHTLGQLSVVRLPDIHLSPSPAELSGPDSLVTVRVDLTPTINHCSLATIIGLAVRCRLEQTLPPNYRVDVRMKAGTHAQDDQVTKQLGDKERVAAALENDTLQRMLDKMLETCA